MEKKPLVSIVIPFYNCRYVNQAIESALNQTYSNTEVIVINDGSTLYEEKLEPYLGRIRYIKKGNGGTASALNMGIQNMSGQYFTWLSSDDLYAPNKVAVQLKQMQESKALVSYGSYYLINEHNQKVEEHGVGIEMPNRRSFIERMKVGCIINGCTVMLEKSVFDRVGLFDQTLRNTQDYDMWLRIMQYYHFHYVKEPLVYYRVHEQMGSKQKAAITQIELNSLQKRYFVPIKQLLRGEKS